MNALTQQLDRKENQLFGLGKKAQARKDAKAEAKAQAIKDKAQAQLLSAQAELEIAKGMNVPSVPLEITNPAPDKKKSNTVLIVVIVVIVVGVAGYFLYKKYAK